MNTTAPRPDLTVWGSVVYGWHSGVTVGLCTLSGAAAGVFVWWERRVAEPVDAFVISIRLRELP